jgi:peptidoglycan hydrolase-like protein with peptidoglycan-binding domain
MLRMENPDGAFGPATRKAVRREQRRLRTATTGIWTDTDQRAWERDRARSRR